MTIREHFQRFQKRVSHVTMVVAVAAVIAFVLRYPHAKTAAAYAFGGVLALVYLAVFMLFLRKRYACPRCNADFVQLRREQVGRISLERRMFWDLWDKCPHCGLRFDAPWEG